MAKANSSSSFTTIESKESEFGPPLIGALLRVPWEAVQAHMLARLHAEGFAATSTRATSRSSAFPARKANDPPSSPRVAG